MAGLEVPLRSSSSSSLTHLRPEVLELKRRLDAFVENECIPAEREHDDHLRLRRGSDRWTLEAVPPCLDRLKRRARELGLWNLFIPPHLVDKVPRDHPSGMPLSPSVPLTYREYGILCESLGRCPSLAPEACNSSAPDTGNMEVLLEFGTPRQRREYLLPLLRGEVRSAFLMTEPAVASSDPTNLETRLIKRVKKDGGGGVEYELVGEKWWSTGAMDPRCRLALVVARMDYSQMPPDQEGAKSLSSLSSSASSPHGAHTIVAVLLPHPQVKCVRALTAFGYDDAPSGHAQVKLEGVRLSEEDLILGEGSGFRVSQARLGPGRIHHCMRAVGIASRCYDLMVERSLERRAFGKLLWEHGGCQEMIAASASDLEAARLLTLACADAMDRAGARSSRDRISSIKVAVPRLAHAVVDRAVQVFGAAGLSEDFVLARALAALRTLRIADGPDEVHKRTVARIEVAKARRRLLASKL